MSSPTGGRPTSTGPVPPPMRLYPHVAACAGCREYVASLTDYPADIVMSATLAYHDSGHGSDPLLVASQHFG